MAEIKTIRSQMYAAIRRGLVDLVLSDPSWGVSGRNVVSEPSEVPQVEDTLSVRIITLNAARDMQPFLFAGEQGEDPEVAPTQYTMSLVESRLRVQAMGARAYAWLDVFLRALEDDATLLFFENLGFSVSHDGTGIQDISSVVGAREQLRGVAFLDVGCRVIRERVTPFADTISFGVTVEALDPDTPATVISITESLE